MATSAEEIAMAKEMLKKASQILIKNNEPVPSTSGMLSEPIWNFISQCDQFNGELEWQVYKEQFEYKLSLITNDDNVKKRVLITILNPSVYATVSNHLSTAIQDSTYGDISKALQSIYGKQTLHWDEMKKFRFAQMEPGEGVQKFFQRLKELAKACKLKDIDEQVRDQLMVGVPGQIFEKICEKPNNISLQEALQACLAAEFKSNSVESRNNDVAFHVNNRSNNIKKRLGPRPAPKSGKPKWEERGCFRCLARDHRGLECPFEKAICYYCKGEGHLGKACRKKRRERHTTHTVAGNK